MLLSPEDSIFFSPSTTRVLISVLIFDDNDCEDKETFVLFGFPLNEQQIMLLNNVTITIIDNDCGMLTLHCALIQHVFIV